MRCGSLGGRLLWAVFVVASAATAALIVFNTVPYFLFDNDHAFFLEKGAFVRNEETGTPPSPAYTVTALESPRG